MMAAGLGLGALLLIGCSGSDGRVVPTGTITKDQAVDLVQWLTHSRLNPAYIMGAKCRCDDDIRIHFGLTSFEMRCLTCQCRGDDTNNSFFGDHRCFQSGGFTRTSLSGEVPKWTWDNDTDSKGKYKIIFKHCSNQNIEQNGSVVYTWYVHNQHTPKTRSITGKSEHLTYTNDQNDTLVFQTYEETNTETNDHNMTHIATTYRVNISATHKRDRKTLVLKDILLEEKTSDSGEITGKLSGALNGSILLLDEKGELDTKGWILIDTPKTFKTFKTDNGNCANKIGKLTIRGAHHTVTLEHQQDGNTTIAYDEEILETHPSCSDW